MNFRAKDFEFEAVLLQALLEYAPGVADGFAAGILILAGFDDLLTDASCYPGGTWL